jgi:Glu-tRNA(Gln) amidotransferase subunit E-like FAD-binding protein
VIEKIRSQNPVVTVGQLMGMVMKELSGRVDGNRVRAMIESTQKPS